MLSSFRVASQRKGSSSASLLFRCASASISTSSSLFASPSATQHSSHARLWSRRTSHARAGLLLGRFINDHLCSRSHLNCVWGERSLHSSQTCVDPQQAVVSSLKDAFPTVVVFVAKEDVNQRASWLQKLIGNTATDPSSVNSVAKLLELADKDFSGKSGSTQMLYVSPYSTSGSPQRIIFVGLGETKKIDEFALRKATHSATKVLQDAKITEASFIIPYEKSSLSLSAVKLDGELPRLVDIIARSTLLSNHSFNKHLKEPATKLKNVNFVLSTAEDESSSSSSSQSLIQLISRARVITDATVLARELANERADIVTPEYLENVARDIASDHKLMLKTLSNTELLAEGLNLLVAVGQASKHPPRLVCLEYKGDANANNCMAIVGKGITFDTGGLNIKATGSIEHMHLDMGGAAAVLGVMQAIAQLELPINVVGAIALAENCVDANSYKPHAIIKTIKGSIEISNTDAEGRLALADAFTFVQKTYKPTHLIDLATLTGACVRALGDQLAGIFGNNDKLVEQLIQSGSQVYERCWRLPVLTEHQDSLKGEYSDYKTTGGNPGASIAAAFLQIFIEEGVAWAHIDIAGPAMMEKANIYQPKGGTGFGVQLIVDFLQKQRQS